MLPGVGSTPRRSDGKENEVQIARNKPRKLRGRATSSSRTSSRISSRTTSSTRSTSSIRERELNRLRAEREASAKQISRSTPRKDKQSSKNDSEDVYVRAIEDFDPVGPRDLELYKGDIIKVIAYGTRDRMKGEINGIIGIFPSSVVEPYKPPVVPPRPKRRSFNRKEFQDATDESLVKRKTFVIEEFSNAQPPDPLVINIPSQGQLDLKSKTGKIKSVTTPFLKFDRKSKYQVQKEKKDSIALKACIMLQKIFRGLIARKRYFLTIRRVVLIQSIVRGFLARLKAQDLRRDAAKANGVLMACIGTVQGKNGWYEFDGGDRFYFMVDKFDNWELVYGPMKEATWQKCMKHVKGIGRCLLPLPGTTAGQTGIYLNSNGDVYRMMAHD